MFQAQMRSDAVPKKDKDEDSFQAFEEKCTILCAVLVETYLT
jgi:hypothetical protein